MYIPKKDKGTLDESEISVPRGRNGNYSLMIVEKRQNTLDGVENIIISLYIKGMSVLDIEQQVHQLKDSIYQKRH